jgi:hypothetical protein
MQVPSKNTLSGHLRNGQTKNKRDKLKVFRTNQQSGRSDHLQSRLWSAMVYLQRAHDPKRPCKEICTLEKG